MALPLVDFLYEGTSELVSIDDIYATAPSIEEVEKVAVKFASENKITDVESRWLVESSYRERKEAFTNARTACEFRIMTNQYPRAMREAIAHSERLVASSEKSFVVRSALRDGFVINKVKVTSVVLLDPRLPSFKFEQILTDPSVYFAKTGAVVAKYYCFPYSQMPPTFGKTLALSEDGGGNYRVQEIITSGGFLPYGEQKPESATFVDLPSSEATLLKREFASNNTKMRDTVRLKLTDPEEHSFTAEIYYDIVPSDATEALRLLAMYKTQVASFSKFFQDYPSIVHNYMDTGAVNGTVKINEGTDIVCGTSATPPIVSEFVSDDEATFGVTNAFILSPYKVLVLRHVHPSDSRTCIGKIGLNGCRWLGKLIYVSREDSTKVIRETPLEVEEEIVAAISIPPSWVMRGFKLTGDDVDDGKVVIMFKGLFKADFAGSIVNIVYRMSGGVIDLRLVFAYFQGQGITVPPSLPSVQERFFSVPTLYYFTSMPATTVDAVAKFLGIETQGKEINTCRLEILAKLASQPQSSMSEVARRVGKLPDLMSRVGQGIELERAVLSPDDIAEMFTRFASNEKDARRRAEWSAAAKAVREYAGPFEDAYFPREEYGAFKALKSHSVREAILQYVRAGYIETVGGSILPQWFYSRSGGERIIPFPPKRTTAPAQAATQIVQAVRKAAASAEDEQLTPVNISPKEFEEWIRTLTGIFKSAPTPISSMVPADRADKSQWFSLAVSNTFTYIHVVMLASSVTRSLGGGGGGGNVFDILKQQFGPRIKRDISPPIPRSDDVAGFDYVVAACPRIGAPFRTLRLTTIENDRVWPYQVVAMLSSKEDYEKLVRVAAHRGINLTPFGSNASMRLIRPNDVLQLGTVVDTKHDRGVIKNFGKFVLDGPSGVAAAVRTALARKPAPPGASVEIEVRFDNITPQMFYTLLSKLSDQYRPIKEESTVTLFSVPHLRDVRMVTRQNGSVSMMEKSNVFAMPIPEAGVRVSASYEKETKPLAPGDTPQISGVRKRTRFSFVLSEAVRIDATIVVKLNRAGVAEFTSHEVEVECTDARRLLDLTDVLNHTYSTLFKSPKAITTSRKCKVIDEFNLRMRDAAAINPIELSPEKTRERVQYSFPSAAVCGYRVSAAVSVLFPPRNLKKYDIVEKGLGGKGGGNYSVAVKADGEPRLLYVDEETNVWMIAPPGEVMLVCSVDSYAPGSSVKLLDLVGTTVAGELVPPGNHTFDTRFIFVPFDLMSPPKKGVPRGMTVPVLDNYVTRSLSAKELCEAIDTLTVPATGESRIFKFVYKPIVEIVGSTPESIATAIESSHYSEDLGFKTDGLIFTPVNKPHNPFGAGVRPPPLFRRSLPAFADICKLKPWSELTIDFRVVSGVRGVGGEGSGNALLVITKQSTEVPFTPENDVSFDFDTHVDWATLYSQFPNSDGMVVEFGPELVYADSFAPVVRSEDDDVFSEPRGEPGRPTLVVMKPRRLRLDKTFPNGIEIARDVWRDIENPVGFKTVAGSINFELLWQQNNSLKRNLFEATFSPEEAAPCIVIDIGSGRGGDVRKYRKHIEKGKIAACILVEPDDDNHAELVNRVESLPDIIKSRMKIVNTVAQDTSTIVGAVRASLQHEEGRIGRVVIVSMLSLSFFWKSKDTLDALVQTLSCIVAEAHSFGVRQPVEFLYFTIHGPRLDAMFSERGVGALSLGPVDLRKREGNEVWVDIKGTIVRDQTEYLVNLDDLRPMMSGDMPVLESVVEPFLSKAELVYCKLFVHGKTTFDFTECQKNARKRPVYPAISWLLPHPRKMVSKLMATFASLEVFGESVDVERVMDPFLGGIGGIVFKRSEADALLCDRIYEHYFEHPRSRTVVKAGSKATTPREAWKELAQRDDVKLLSLVEQHNLLFGIEHGISGTKNVALISRFLLGSAIKSVLEPYARWGAGLLAAIVCGCDVYQGCDSETKLHPIYNQIISDFSGERSVGKRKNVCHMKDVADIDEKYDTLLLNADDSKLDKSIEFGFPRVKTGSTVALYISSLISGDDKQRLHAKISKKIGNLIGFLSVEESGHSGQKSIDTILVYRVSLAARPASPVAARPASPVAARPASPVAVGKAPKERASTKPPAGETIKSKHERREDATKLKQGEVSSKRKEPKPSAAKREKGTGVGTHPDVEARPKRKPAKAEDGEMAGKDGKSEEVVLSHRGTRDVGGKSRPRKAAADVAVEGPAPTTPVSKPPRKSRKAKSPPPDGKAEGSVVTRRKREAK